MMYILPPENSLFSDPMQQNRHRILRQREQGGRPGNATNPRCDPYDGENNA
jgi:hypothetical protein